MHHFEKYKQEADQFIITLSEELNHRNQPEQTLRILKAVLHTVRDRITISESFDLMAQLPMLLKGLYVHQWKYAEKTDEFRTMEDFVERVKERQRLFGEKDFDWDEPSREIVLTVLKTLYITYLSTGQLDHIIDQLPKDVKETVFAELEG
ncbi:DUF2267 domain-containing protein [Roseivirga sp. BDSF3-8]|uniref:DUF2267 domain-containing protein n=1 Tax=Roseivirga sp. BDSF3-8 TaxID=3241598 RepID=UPI003531FB33